MKLSIESIILPKLDQVIDRGGGRWYACCPAHDDTSPSLSIGTGNEGQLLLHCFAGCSAEQVLSALGLGWRDVYPDKWEAAKRAAYAHKTKPLKLDPLELERTILRIVAADLRAGKELSAEDRARAKVARLRLQAAGGSHGR